MVHVCLSNNYCYNHEEATILLDTRFQTIIHPSALTLISINGKKKNKIIEGS
jgi:hypothetical protein